MDKVLLVARWEFMRNFKWKQELGAYLIMLGIFGAMFAVQTWEQSSKQTTINLAVIGELNQNLDEKFQLQSLTSGLEQAAVFEYIEANGLDGVLSVDKVDAFTLYAPQQSGWQVELKRTLAEGHQDVLLGAMDVSEKQLQKLQNPIQFTFFNQAEQLVGGNVKALGTIAAILSLLAVLTSFGLSMTSVTQEKQHRVTEQLLTCVTHQQWVDGKAIGLCLASLKSLLTTTILIMLGISGFALFSGENNVPNDIPWMVALQIFLFCTLGIFFWNYVFVGFSATIDDPNHSGKTGIMMLPMLPVSLVFMVLGEPNGEVAKILSLIPLTSISFMPMRIASMDVPFWQVGLSLLLLFAGIYYVRLFASRIFRTNITLFGKEPGWADIWRSMLKSDKA
ncbi:ABC transporter permease [Porticoccaceae bacterium]|nr:ABC transporter permease [Porticoccaceae bacterium]